MKYLKSIKANYILILVFFILAVFVVYFFLKQKKQSTNLEKLKVSDNSKNLPLVVEEPQVKIAKEITQKTFKELKETAPDIVKSPNIVDAKEREVLLKDVKNEDPQNYRLFFDGSKLEKNTVTILQGDYVTWVNNSKGEMTIKGEQDWGTVIPVPPNKGFTQEFNFKGAFNYTINNTYKAKVIVK